MRWLERVFGLLSGLLAVVAGLLSSRWQAERVLHSASCVAACQQGVYIYGPDINVNLHNTILSHVVIIIAATLALAACALLDARRPTHSHALSALGLIAAMLCAVSVGVLLTSHVVVTYVALTSAIIPHYNVGLLFVPTLVVAFACLFTILWPRQRVQAIAAGTT